MKKHIVLCFLLIIITILANAQTIANGFVGNHVVVKNKLYMFYRSNGVNQLVEYDGQGNFKILIPNLKNSFLFSYKDNLYIDCLFNGINQLAKYDGVNFNLIPMPNKGTFITPRMALLNDTLYFDYHGDRQNQIAKFDGNTLTPIPTPTNFNIAVTTYKNNSNFVTYENCVYFNLIGSDRTNELAKFDGKTVSIVAPIQSTINAFANPQTVFNIVLFINYRMGSDDNPKQQLATFDGTHISIIPNPDMLGNVNENNFVSYKNALYFEYQSWTNTNTIPSNLQLAKYDGKKISLIPNPSDDGRVYFNGSNNLIMFDNALYFEYYNSEGGTIRGEDGKRQLAKYDGIKITLIPNPDVEGKINSEPFVFDNNLYCLYSNYNGGGQLGKLNPINGPIQLIDYKPVIAENIDPIFR